MVVRTELKEKFWDKTGIRGVDLETIDEVAQKDANILRPIEGVCFETLFKNAVENLPEDVEIELGEGDEDVDIYLEDQGLQLKTPATHSSGNGKISVSLHKTHGREERPYNLYEKSEEPFDFLVVKCPKSGVLIVPLDQIPEASNYEEYLADPAKFDEDSKWKNRWDLLGLSDYKGESIENRTVNEKSELPHLSEVTGLSDEDIIRTLIKDPYFRATIMGLKGNLKEDWFVEQLDDKLDSEVREAEGAYPDHDVVVDKGDREIQIQVKGVSQNMCDSEKGRMGVEVMGTHNRFPERGYKRDAFDYVAVIIKDEDLPNLEGIDEGLHFVILPSADLPTHYLVGNGKEDKENGWANRRWNKEEFSNVLYPNIKLKVRSNLEGDIVAVPNLDSYGSYRGYDTIPQDSEFRDAGPFKLDELPDDISDAKVGDN